MKQETIEGAAFNYAAQRFPNGEDKHCGTVAQEQYACLEGFIAGVTYQSNRVWHDMKSEEPQLYGEYENEVYPQIPCLVRGQLSTGYGYGVRYWNITEKVWDDEECDDIECNKDDIEEWAYLDDLLPTSFDEILEGNKDVLQRLRDNQNG